MESIVGSFMVAYLIFKENAKILSTEMTFFSSSPSACEC
jgi:hypothetical protein